MTERHRPMGAVLVTAVVVLAVAACSSSPGPATAPPTAAPPTLVDAPAIVTTRAALPSCGVDVAVEQGSLFSVADRTARACFWTAYVRGDPAELIGTLQRSTGLITIITRSLGSGRAELFVETPRQTGGGSWTHLVCNGLQPIVDGPVKPDWAPGIPPSVGCTSTQLTP